MKSGQKLRETTSPADLHPVPATASSPETARCGPGSRGRRGKGGVSAPGALARPRGDRKPGHRGLSLASTAQPQPGRKFCRALSAGYIVEQETGHRGSRAVEQAAPDADPTRVCRDKWKLGQQAKVLRCPGRAGLREGWCWGGWWESGKGAPGGRPHPGALRTACPSCCTGARAARAWRRAWRPDPRGGALGVGLPSV